MTSLELLYTVGYKHVLACFCLALYISVGAVEICIFNLGFDRVYFGETKTNNNMHLQYRTSPVRIWQSFPSINDGSVSKYCCILNKQRELFLYHFYIYPHASVIAVKYPRQISKTNKIQPSVVTCRLVNIPI